MMKSNTVNQVMLEPNTKADVVFSALADLTALCENYGQYFYPGLPDPTKCNIVGNDAYLKVSLDGERPTDILQAINLR